MSKEGPDKSREGPDKFGGVQITIVINFIGHVWSKIGHVQKISLETGLRDGHVRFWGLNPG
jgi:hypothetical protein